MWIAVIVAKIWGNEKSGAANQGYNAGSLLATSLFGH